jgi:hypothetical protein
MKPQQSFGVSLVLQMEAFLKHNREITIHGTPMGIWAAALPQYFKNHHTLYKAHQIQRWGIEMENNLDDETPVPDRKEMAWTGLLSGALILIVFNIEGISSWGNSTLIEDFIREIYGSSYFPPDKKMVRVIGINAVLVAIFWFGRVKIGSIIFGFARWFGAKA